MKIYLARYPGHYLGAETIVIANDRGHARRLLDREIAAPTVEFGVNLTLEEIPFVSGTVVLVDDGDY